MNAARRRPGGSTVRTRGRGPARPWVGWVSGVVVAALVVTLAVVASGFDSRETPREDPSVWAMRASGQYARINTETAEIDTVRQVQSPNAVVQSGGFGVVLTQGSSRAWPIDPAAPKDIGSGGAASADGGESGDDEAASDGDTAAAEDEDAEDAGDAVTAGTVGTAAESTALRTPAGTRQVTAAGGWVLFATESGEAYLSTLPADGRADRTLPSPSRLDPLAEENADRDPDQQRDYEVDAAALDADGLVALYSDADRSVRWFDARTGGFRQTVSEVPEGLPDEDLQLAVVGGEWVLLDAAGGRLWREGAEAPVELELAGEALLQGSSIAARGAAALVADEAGLWSVGDVAARVAEFGGAPARPEQVGDGMVAAWLASDAGAMWTEAGGQVGLEVEASQDGVDEFAPVIQTGGNRAVLSETSTGMLWTVPDGRLIPTAQWDLVDPPKQVSGTVVSEATEQKPPVAVNDAFGVRAGEPVPLPVLLNDYDPNRSDVLTIVPDGLGEGLPEDFGQVELLSDGQGLMLQPSPAASGSAVFSYRITDGVAVSEPARVELRVVGEETNTAPQWCPVVGCQRSWPSPTIVPGGTLVLPVLEGWVDAEGDPMMLTDATLVDDQDPARALVTADGRLAVRHTDPNAADGEISVQVRVAGSRGGSTERTLRIGVRADAVAEIEAIAATVATGQPTTVHPLNRVSGGSGSFALVDAAVQSGTVRVVANPSAGTVSLTAQTPGNSLVSVTVRDTVTKRESNGVIRVTAMEERPALALPPLRAFVRPLGDTTIEVLDAIPGASSRSLSVRSATVVAGELRADVIEHARIRLSGSTADGQPGLIGSAEVVVAEGERIARGRITVFQVPEVSSAGAIAVADAATVRAGSVVDIPVLDNDVAAPGERLVLHPEVSASGAEGELAFVSGRRLRYLAPDQPGTYTLGYTTYGASSPRRSDVGTVQVTVIAAGANTDPKPASLIVRVAPGERVNAVVPVSNIDPDGDRVRLVDVEQPAEAQLSATILPRTGTIQVSASANAEPSEEIIGYTVRDGFGGEGVGRLRIIVTEPDPAGGAPVVYSDYVRMERGVSEPVAVRPLDNDVDPAGGALELVEVVPNAPGGRDSALYRELAARLDTSALGRGIVTIAGSDESGTVSFRYVVRSRATGSTSDGLIVVQVSDRIGRQAPNVQDTVLTVKDRADLTGGGVDVVTGRVQWATGDISKLRLSLWGEAAGRYRVSGSSISGEYRPEGDLVAFRLTGRDAAGVEVSGYGFLIVPPLDELRLTLKAGAAPLSVEEGRSVEADVRELLDLGSGDDIVLDGGAFGVQRSQAACSAIGDTTIRYAAGREAPWRDACMIRVRLAEQTVFTVLPIPIDIVPDDPTVQLHPLGRTIAPGETQTIELAEMLTWQGGRTGDAAALSWRIAGEGVFEFGPLDPASGRLAVTAPAGASTGAQTLVRVDVAGAGESRSTLTLRVGEAARDAPVGGTVRLDCRVGSTCRAPLVGAGVAGQIDPFAGKSGGGLAVRSVEDPGCRYGRILADGDSVAVEWADRTGPGGTCEATFTVEDAQHRPGTGTITLDASGLPRAPQSISAVGFTATSVRLQVVLGEAANAYPELQEIRIMEGDAAVPADCSASGGSHMCEVSGLKAGEVHQFSAVAVNRVGASTPTGPVRTWAFRLPEAPSVDAVQQISAESVSEGTVRFQVSSSDSSTGSIDILINGRKQATVAGASGTATIARVSAGDAVAYQAVANSRFPHPSGESNTGGTTSGTTAVGGLPEVTSLILESAPLSPTVTARIEGRSNYGGALLYGATSAGACTPTSSTSSIELVGTLFQNMNVDACVSNTWGVSAVKSGTIRVGGRPEALTGLSYSIGAVPEIEAGTRIRYTEVVPPEPSPRPGFDVEYRLGTNGPTGSAFPELDPGSVQTVFIRQVQGGATSEWAEVVPAGAPAPVIVDLGGCISTPVEQSALRERVSAAARSAATVAYDEATGMLGIDWTGSFASFDPPPPQPIPVCP